MSTKEILEVAEIPPIAYQDYPIDIHLRIYREGDRYKADIHAVGRMLRVSIPLSPHDLAILNAQLQREMQGIARENLEQEPTAAELEAQLRPLAEVGNYAFKRIFGNHDALIAIQELLPSKKPSILTAIQKLLPPSRRVSIQVASEDFFLPWELIYPASLDDDEPLSYEHFWGMNYIISRVIVQEARPGAFVSPVIPVGPRPKLGLLTYLELPSVREKEIPFFEKLDGDGKIALFKLRALNPKKKREEFKEFRSFWEKALNLAHFACHAFYEDESPNLSRILLSDEFPITLQDMEVYGITISGHPLIIMNACETGNLNPLYTSYFAAAFLKYGARGVVATECAVPDAFAADFAQQLYAHLLAGEPLGESLLATRRYFLEKYHNPSGLLYSMYAPPSIRLAQIGG
jgi:hypothetical protein